MRQSDEVLHRLGAERIDVARNLRDREAERGRSGWNRGFIQQSVIRQRERRVGWRRRVGRGISEMQTLLNQFGMFLLNAHPGVAARVALFIVNPDFQIQFPRLFAGEFNELDPAVGKIRDLISFPRMKHGAATAGIREFLQLSGDFRFILHAVPEPERIEAGTGNPGKTAVHKNSLSCFSAFKKRRVRRIRRKRSGKESTNQATRTYGGCNTDSTPHAGGTSSGCVRKPARAPSDRA